MNIYPLPGSLQPGPVDAGWSRTINHGPMTIREVLERARDEMDAEDERERQAADPLLLVRAYQRRNLLGRLLHGWR